MTRTRSASRSKLFASTARVPRTHCVESCTVNSPSRHSATVADGSIGLCVSSGVTYVASTRTGLRAYTPSGSPRRCCISSPNHCSGDSIVRAAPMSVSASLAS